MLEVTNQTFSWIREVTNFDSSGNVTSSTRTPVEIKTTFTTETSDPPVPEHRPGKLWFENQGKKIIITDHNKSSLRRTHINDNTGMVVRYNQTTYRSDGSKASERKGMSARMTITRHPPASLFGDPEVLSKIDTCRRAAHNSALASANEAAWDVLTFLGEGPETIAYIGDKLAWVYAFLRRKGRPPSSRSKPKDLDAANSRWLEYRYAIIPMAMDISNMLTALNYQEQFFSTKRGSQSSSHFVRNEKILYDKIKVVESSSVSIRANSCVYTIFSEQQQRALRLMAFVPSTAWELVRLSFVFDWFINVGDFILTLRPIEYVQRGMTDSVKLIQSSSCQYFPLDSFYEGNQYNVYDSFEIVSGDSVVSYYDSYDRTVVNPNPVIPPVNAKLNWRRCLDAFALTWPSIRRGLSSAKEWF